MTKTAINIDRELAAEAQRVLDAPTLTATVDGALREVVRQARIAEAMELLKGVDYRFLDQLDRQGE